jgi:hypothetical protein
VIELELGVSRLDVVRGAGRGDQAGLLQRQVELNVGLGRSRVEVLCEAGQVSD